MVAAGRMRRGSAAVGLQIIRDWVLRFNARGPDGLVDGKSPGAPSKLNADHRRELPRVCRRLFGLSQATISSSLICA